MAKRVWQVILSVILILTMVAIPATASPAGDESGATIYLERAIFDPLVDAPTFLELDEALREPSPDSAIVLLQFEGPVEEEWKISVEDAGVELLDYIPDFAFRVRLHGLSAEDAASLPHVRWIGPYRNIYKVALALDDLSLQSEEPLEIVVSFFRGEDPASVIDQIGAWGGEVLDSASSEILGEAVRVRLPALHTAELATLPAVSYVEPYYPNALDNDRGRTIMAVPDVWTKMTAAGTNLFGSGQIVDVVDTGLDTGNAGTLSEDFKANFLKGYAWGRSSTNDWSDIGPNGGHGTHVAGSVLGSGKLSGSNPTTHNYSSSFAGVAPEARLVFQSLMNTAGQLVAPTDLKQLYTPAHNDGARVHTNSWGHPTGGSYPNYTYGGYDSAARYIDEFMWLYPTSLVLFSAGNNGVDANSNGVIDNDEIGSPGTAKNILTVGATENNRPPASGFGGYSQYKWGTGSWEAHYPVNPIHDDYISNNIAGLAAFSSRGPTDDGRIKPEIVAPGTDIISARSHASGSPSTGWGVYNSHYIYNGGTSMSTPLTAGASALVRQFYTDVKHVTNPSAALVKATMINGAANITPGQYGTGATREIPANTPNNVIGFGRVNLMNSMALNTNEGLRYWDITSGLKTNGKTTYTVGVSKAGGASDQFAATLCWTDYPGTVGAGKALVNDLDLEVVGPDGVHYKGNGGASWDRLNTTERIVVGAPKAGNYQVIVSGYSVSQSSQPYAMVVSGDYVGGTTGAKTVDLPLIMKRAAGAVRPTATPTATVKAPTTVTLSSNADACVLEGYPTTNAGSTSDMLVGYDDYMDPDGKIVRGLIKFNLASIPSSATVQNATLRVYMNSWWDYPSRNDTITLYRTTGTWTEGGVTWNTKPNFSTAYGTVTIPSTDTAYGWYEFTVTTLVQSWLTGAAQNFGVTLRGEEASGTDSSWRAFSTKEGQYAPELIVTYMAASGEAELPAEENMPATPGDSILNLSPADGLAGGTGRIQGHE